MITEIATKHDSEEQVKPIGLAQGGAQAMDQLASIFAAYNETTERLRASHEQLQAEVARLREELQEKNEQLQRKSRLAALGEMAAGMAHEIRNPLGGVQLYASLLERDLAALPAQQQLAQKIQNGVRSLERIVSGVLAFTQDQACVKVPVLLAEVAAEVLDLCRAKCGETIELRNEVPAGLVVQGDADMLQRMLLNLALNAVEALEGAARGKVLVRADRQARDENYQVRVQVIDNGPGIKPELLSKIFNPFFTTRDSGTGLGLAIVHRLVECHGGAIMAANYRTAGAIFTILLP